MRSKDTTIPDEAVERFFRYFTVSQSGCWEWSRGIHPEGYGRLKINKVDHGAHRISWRIHNGAIPAGMFICHHCDNRKCCNPAHLFLGSPSDNTQDMVRKGRGRNGVHTHPNRIARGKQCGVYTHPECYPKGADRSQAKLTDAMVREIRAMYSIGQYTQKQLAAIFDVSPATIGHLLQGRKWTHVK